MRKCLKIRQILSFLMFVMFAFNPMELAAQTKDDVVNVLVEMGFENVGCVENEDERVYVLQNSAYRVNGLGLAKAIDVIQETGLPQNKACRVIALDNNVPQISLRYQPVAGDSAMVASREDWQVTYELGNSWKEARKAKRKNSSLFKVDVLVYPELALKNLIINQIYQVLFQLSPAIEVSFWKGMKLSAQVKIPIYNDGYGYVEDAIHPAFITASQSFRLPYNIFGKVTFGSFNFYQYGVDVEFHRPFRDERFSVLARLGYTGMGIWEKFKYHYDTEMTWTWSLGASFYWPQYNTQFSLKAEQYLLRDKGVRFDMIRHFRYCSIGFFAMKGKDAKTNGGFRFQVLLPPYKYKRTKYYPRIMPSPNMGIAYNAGNEQKYYQQYRAEAGDNMMRRNSFNPYYIKSEMLNY